jgi:hypothetical protein
VWKHVKGTQLYQLRRKNITEKSFLKALCSSFSTGIPGNIFIILIAQRKHNRKLSTSIYMTAMAVADTIAVTFAMSLGPVVYTELVQEESIRGWLYLYVNIFRQW